MPALSISDWPTPDSADLFDRPHAADPSPRAAALLAPIPELDADLSPELIAEARPGYGDPPPPFYASPDSRLRLYQADALELLRRPKARKTATLTLSMLRLALSTFCLG